MLTANPTPDSSRELVASGRICAIGKCVGLGFTPWDVVTGPTHRLHLTSATFASYMATFSYLNFNYLFYSCSANLVGGNSTVWSNSNTSCTYFRIDEAGTPGYLTSA